MRAVLLDAMGGVEAARWQEDEQLHLTLRYIGETDPRVADDLVGALGRIDARRFELTVRGTGFFERKGQPSALWARIAPDPALETLQKKVERTCQAVGLEPEHRKFVPHITLARLNASAGPIAPWLADNSTLSTPPWPVDGFRLYESTLTPGGSLYDPLIEWPLH